MSNWVVVTFPGIAEPMIISLNQKERKLFGFLDIRYMSIKIDTLEWLRFDIPYTGYHTDMCRFRLKGCYLYCKDKTGSVEHGPLLLRIFLTEYLVCRNFANSLRHNFRVPVGSCETEHLSREIENLILEQIQADIAEHRQLVTECELDACEYADLIILKAEEMGNFPITDSRYSNSKSWHDYYQNQHRDAVMGKERHERDVLRNEELYADLASHTWGK